MGEGRGKDDGLGPGARRQIWGAIMPLNPTCVCVLLPCVGDIYSARFLWFIARGGVGQVSSGVTQLSEHC